MSGIIKHARTLEELEQWRRVDRDTAARQMREPEYDLDREDIKLCSPPATAWRLARLPITGAGQVDAVLCSASGRWGACDVYLNVPLDWAVGILTISSKSENITIPLLTVDLALLPRFVRGVGANARFLALPLSIRGRVCDEFIVTGAPIVGGGGEGSIRMEVWDCADQIPIDDIARATTPMPIVEQDAQVDNTAQTFASSRLVTNTPNSRLLQVDGRSASAVTLFYYLFDAVALPIPGTLSDRLPIEVPAGVHFGRSVQPSDFANGIFWAASTTDHPLGLTVAVGANFLVDTYFRP